MSKTMLALTLAMGGIALAAAPDIMVMQSKAIASIPGAPTSVIYLMVHNTGGSKDRLLGASTPLATKVELHSGQLSGGVATMRPIDGIDLPAGGMIEFKTGGNHLMLVGLVRPLQAGTVVPLTLKFQIAGEVKVNVPVVALTSR